MFAAPALADFGLPGDEGFDIALTEQNGSPNRRSGTHPEAFKIKVGLNKAGQLSDGDLRNLDLEMPAGLLINPTAVPECSIVDFHTHRVSPYETSLSGESCADESQVGVVTVHSSSRVGRPVASGSSIWCPPSAPRRRSASPRSASRW